MRTPAAIACFVLLAGCGGKSEPPSIKDVAADIGCSKYEPGEQAMSREAGQCRLDGQDVYLATFTDADQESQYLEVAKAGGGVFVKGDLWMAQVFDAGTADAIAKANGGEVVN